MSIKKCRKCSKELVVGENWGAGNASNSNNICKVCVSDYQKQHYANNKEEIKRKVKEYNNGIRKRRSLPDINLLQETFKTHSLSEVSDEFGISEVTLWRHLRRSGVTRDVATANDMFNTIEPKLLPSPELAYILGVVYGDGFVCKSWVKKEKKWVRVVGLRSSEISFVEKFRQHLLSIGLNPSKIQTIEPPTEADRLRNPNILQKSTLYLVSAISKRFYDWRVKLKLEQLKLEYLVSDASKRAFVCGFYESEGCFYVVKSGYPSVSMCNSDRELVDLVKVLVEYFGFRPPSVYTSDHNKIDGICHKTMYSFVLNGMQATDFIKQIKPTIKLPPLGYAYINKK